MADKLVYGMTGNPIFESSHLASISNLALTSTQVNLEQGILDSLEEEGRLEEDTVRSLMLRKRESDACGTPAVGAMVPEFCSDRYVLLSVNGFGEKLHYTKSIP